jgi:hypothetical protein
VCVCVCVCLCVLFFIHEEDTCSNSGDIPFESKCQVAEGKFIIYYKSLSTTEPSLIEIVNEVFDVLKVELRNAVTDIRPIQSITTGASATIITDNNPNTPVTVYEDTEPLSNSTKALIGVAVVCSTLIIAAVLIITRGRNHGSQHHNKERMNYSRVIIPDRHIRSDDSVSNSPSISSYSRKAMATAGGWDDAIRSEGSQSDCASDTSSRPSFTVQLEEASQSNGIEASRESTLYQTGHSSYLPSSVLKDLLDGSGQSKSFDILDNTVDL